MQFLKGSLGPEEAACVLINSNFTTFLSGVCFLPSSSLCCPFSSPNYTLSFYYYFFPSISRLRVTEQRGPAVGGGSDIFASASSPHFLS